MAKDILMPQMGYDMTEGTVVRWVKKVGDRVHRGDIVAEIETDKATVEIEAFESGTLLRTLADPGETIPVGVPIATLGEAGEELPEPPSKAPAPAAPAPAAPAPAATPPPAPAVSAPPAPPAPKAAAPAPPVQAGTPAAEYAEGERLHASPLARRIAERFGIDLRQVSGSGPGGRIVAGDVEAISASNAPAVAPVPAAAPPEAAAFAAAPPPLPEGAEDIELSRLRQTIARRMAESKRTAPHFYVSVDINADKLLALRQRINNGKTHVSVNDLLVKALALAAIEHPNVNSAYLNDRVRRFKRVDVGIAVATDNGLLSPAILDCATKPLATIADESRDLSARARSGHLKPEEYGGGTITLSNLGMYGTSEFLAILNPPQAVIVSVGAAADRVVMKAGKPAVAKVLTAWAAADHRVLDGAEVAQFMATFRELVEDPRRLNA
ncbi:MAG TPA: dihydrolipoamide acetyltransferase family protein [Candidatus Solibacter sp.]|jgi:pyruvate dehydrogenase E2 component (dihydrolipoamide acetyltransferase)|nr:dihydrolipoamide acetyltransferase family protein [Candidatus Solibacter sp.]